MYATASSADHRNRPGTLTRFVAAILVLVIMLSIVALIVGNWYRSTILSVDWYQPVIKSEAFQNVIRDSIVTEVSKDIGQSGFFASFLTQAMENVLTNERIEVFLDTYIIHFVDYLNSRSATPLPTDAAELFGSAFLTMAQEAGKRLGVPLPFFVEKQIEQLAIKIGEVAEKNIDILTRGSFGKLAELEKYHRVLLWISQSTEIFILALAAGLILLLLLFLRQISRFFSHAFFGAWLAGAAIGLPLLAVRASDLTGPLIDAPAVIKPVLEKLISYATDQLKQTGLTVLAGTTIALVIVFVIRLMKREKVR